MEKINFSAMIKHCEAIMNLTYFYADFGEKWPKNRPNGNFPSYSPANSQNKYMN